jgi:uncharacterized protein YcbK (DUF882 family)
MARFFDYDTDPRLACSCCGARGMADAFLDRLDVLRLAFGKPLSISSGYRCPKHNAAVSSSGPNGPHTTGCAVDIPVSGADAYRLVQLATAQGFRGIGIAQKGAAGTRFIHLDDLDGPTRPRIWSY